MTKTRRRKRNRGKRKKNGNFCGKLPIFSLLFKKISAFSHQNWAKKRKTCGNLRINENLIFFIQIKLLRATIFIVFANDFSKNEADVDIKPI